MSLIQKFGIIIFIVTIILCVISMSALDFRVKKSAKLWSLLTCQALIVISILYSSKIIPEHGFDITPVTFVVFITVVSVLVFKNRMIDILSLASGEVYMDLGDPVLILDKQGMPIDLNKPAELMFSTHRSHLGKINWEDILNRADPDELNRQQIERIRNLFRTDTETNVKETLQFGFGNRRIEHL